jgi:acetyl-CoA acetyltransferase
MSGVKLVGTGMTPFARSPERGLRDLATSAAAEALADAGITAADVEKIYVGNAAAGIVTHQEMIRGQVAFRNSDLAGKPLINVENACASGSSALSLACDSIVAGHADVVLVVGAEQLNHPDKSRTFAALRGSTDIGEIGEADGDEIATNSVLMDFYAAEARAYLDANDATADDLARVAVKNRRNATYNPLAQYQSPQTIEEVLVARMIVPPLTLPMCSPTTDGAAALVLCSTERAEALAVPALTVLACEIAGTDGQGRSPVLEASAKAYRAAGLGPADVDVIELHDAAAPAELIQYAEIGLCDEGEGHHMLRRGETEIGGRIPVNTSGGLLSRGHPLGATGCAQIVELATQLRGRANGRQVEAARTALAINGGGWLAGTYAVAVATIVQAA